MSSPVAPPRPRRRLSSRPSTGDDSFSQALHAGASFSDATGGQAFRRPSLSLDTEPAADDADPATHSAYSALSQYSAAPSPRPTSQAPDSARTPPDSASSYFQSPLTTFQFPAVPSLSTPTPATPPRAPLQQDPAPAASTSSYTVRPPRTSSVPSSPALNASAPVVGSPFGSARKKAPPPLELSRPPAWELDSARRLVRGHGAESSQAGASTQERWREDSSSSVEQPHRRQPSAGTSLASPSSLGPATSSTPRTRSESRDTLSQMTTTSFRASPLLDHPIPTSTLSFSPPRSPPNADDEPGPGEDDTAHTHLSSSSSTGALSSSPSSNYGSTGFAGARQYTGLGLGLPFSMSAAANLSSVSATSPGGDSSSTTPGRSTASDHYNGAPSSPGGERSRSSTSGADSPYTDRSKLIGLGELATPRWTSGVLERRWGAPFSDAPADGAAQEDDFDFLASYSSDRDSVVRLGSLLVQMGCASAMSC